MATPIKDGRDFGPWGEGVTMSNQARKTTMTRRPLRPRRDSQAEIQGGHPDAGCETEESDERHGSVAPDLTPHISAVMPQGWGGIGRGSATPNVRSCRDLRL